MKRPLTSGRPLKQCGFTLIELMIAMVLGLLLIGGVVSVVLANGQASRANTALAQVQDSARMAFELLARDLRQAGATGCGNFSAEIASGLGTVNPMLNGAVVPWTGVRGYPAGATIPGTVSRIANTDAVYVQGITGAGFLLVEAESTTVLDPTDPNIVISRDSRYDFVAPAGAISDGNIVLACNSGSAAVFRASSVSGSGDVSMTDATGTGFDDTFGGGLVARVNNNLWYIGDNGRAQEGGRSLFRQRLGNDGSAVTEEIIPGVSDMTINYREGDNADFVANPGNWEAVTAVEITLTIDSPDARASTDNTRMQREFTTLIGLRNPRQ